MFSASLSKERWMKLKPKRANQRQHLGGGYPNAVGSTSVFRSIDVHGKRSSHLICASTQMCHEASEAVDLIASIAPANDYPVSVKTSQFPCSTPADTPRNNDVVITPKRRHFDVITSKWRRFDVITTLLLRHVFGATCLVTISPKGHRAPPSL